MKTLVRFVRSNASEILFVCALLGLYLVNAFLGEYNDEWDNILTGKLMADGLTLYRDIFSHHFPLPYVISFVIHLFIDPNFYVFRIIFSLILFVWALALYRSLRESSSRVPWKYFFLLLAFVSPILGMNMLLAEVIVGYSALTILCIVLYRPRPFPMRDLALLTFFAFVIAASAVAYLPLSLFTYVFLVLFILRHRRLYSWKRILFLAAFAFLPYAVTAVILSATGSLNDFLWQNTTFNEEYYLKFLYDYPQSPLAFPLFMLKNLAKGMVSSLNISLANIENSVYLAFFLSAIAFVLSLLKRRLYSSSLIFASIFILSAPRLATDTGIAHQGNVPFYLISLLVLAIMSSKIFHALRYRFEEFSTNWIAAIGSIVLFFFFAFTMLKVVDVYYSLAFPERRIHNGTEAANFLNKKIQNGEMYWVGPYDFKTQYYVSAPTATRYTFFLPWHAASPAIQDELIQNFENQKPRIIILNEGFVIWNHPFSTYGRTLLDYIQTNYTLASKDAVGNSQYIRKD